MTNLDCDHQVFEFFEAVFRQRHLREEFGRVFDGIDDLAENLDEEASYSLFVNIRGHLEKLSAQITETDQRVRALMPAMKACLEEEPAAPELPTPKLESLEAFTATASPLLEEVPPKPNTVILAAETVIEEAKRPAGSEGPGEWSGLKGTSDGEPLPWEGVADTVAPDDPSPEATGPSEVFNVLPPGLDDMEEGGGEVREEDMLFWLRENDEEDLAMTLPRATTVGIGERMILSKLKNDDDEITQIFDKGEFE